MITAYKLRRNMKKPVPAEDFAEVLRKFFFDVKKKYLTH